MPSDARVAAMVSVADAGPDDYLIMLTRRGLIKRTPAAAFANVRGAIKNTAIKLLVRAAAFPTVGRVGDHIPGSLGDFRFRVGQ